MSRDRPTPWAREALEAAEDLEALARDAAPIPRRRRDRRRVVRRAIRSTSGAWDNAVRALEGD